MQYRIAGSCLVDRLVLPGRGRLGQIRALSGVRRAFGPGRRLCKARAAAQPAQQQEPSSAGSSAEGTVFFLACPICQTTQLKIQQPRGGRPVGNLRCPRCARTFATSQSGTFLDLTISSGVEQRDYRPPPFGGQDIFRSPLVSFAYERGWRQGFAWAGFPGVDPEFELAMGYLQPANGATLVDMSCGSGLFSRRFLASKKFKGVIAADYSESMLEQARQSMQADPSLQKGEYLLLRADVGRLPFPTGSVAAIHAGAAIHCWPNPQAALAEISRVLRPGGVFVSSTFLRFTARLGAVLGDDFVRPLGQLEPVSSNRSMRFWDESELRDLCSAVGLQDFQRTRRNQFIMFAACKPDYML